MVGIRAVPRPTARCRNLSAMTTLSGVWAAALTPLTSDLAPDPARLGSHFEQLTRDGCDGIVLFGTTGEATSFSVAERIDLLDDLIGSGLPASRVIVGVGCAAAVDTVELTRAAALHGVAAVLMLPPFYYKAVSDDDLFEAYTWIIDRLGSEPPPVLLYNIPQVSGIRISPALAGRLARRHPIVKGLKDSSGDLDSLRGFVGAMPGRAVFAGTELLLVPDEGAVGTISAAANVNASDIRIAYESRDTADIPRLAKVRDILTQHPLIPSLKAVIASRTNDPGWLAVRPPLRPLTADDGKALAAALPAH